MKLINILKSLKMLNNYRNITSCAYDIKFMNFLKNLPQPKIGTLKNSLRVVTEERDNCPTAAVGLFIDGGSRYETEDESGITHFLEHLMFKGMAEAYASMGAEVKCRVGRQIVSLSGECILNDVPDLIKLLADTAFRNNLSVDQIKRQQQIVELELLEHEADHQNAVMDYLHMTAFQGTSLGQPLLGRSDNIKSFNQMKLKSYMEKYWRSNRAVLVVVGGVVHSIMMEHAESACGDLVEGPPEDTLIPYRYTGSEIRFRNDAMPSAHIAIAVEGASFCDEDALYLSIAAAYLGGYNKEQGRPIGNANPLSIASSYYAEAHKAFNIMYKDTGLFGVHFISAALDQEDMLFNVQQQFVRLCTCINDGDLERAKYEIKSNILYKSEKNADTCFDIGRWILMHNERPTIPELLNKIDNVKYDEFREICYKYLYDKCPVVAGIGPVEGLPEYNRIRASMYWLRV